MEQSMQMQPVLEIAQEIDAQIHEMILRLSQYEECEYTQKAIASLHEAHRQIRKLKQSAMPGD